MSDLRSMCRICMTKENLTSVFSIMDGGKISDKINFVCGITISSSDVFPKLICHQCLSSIIIASSIKRKAIETEQIFSEMFSMIVDDLTDESIEYIEEKNDNSDDEKSSLLIEMKEDENQFLVYEEDPEIKGQPKMNYNLSEQSVKINNLNHFNYNSELKNFVGRYIDQNPNLEIIKISDLNCIKNIERVLSINDNAKSLTSDSKRVADLEILEIQQPGTSRLLNLLSGEKNSTSNSRRFQKGFPK